MLEQKIWLFIFQILLSVNVDCWKFRVVYHYYEWLLLQLLCWSWWTNHKKNPHQLIRFYSHMHVHVFLLFSSPADFVSYLLSVVPDLFCCSRCVTLSSHLHRRMGKSHLWIIPLNTDYCSWKLQPSLTALSWLNLTAKSPTALLNREPFAVFCKCHTVFNMSVWTPVLPRQPNVSERECSCVCVCGCVGVHVCLFVCVCANALKTDSQSDAKCCKVPRSLHTQECEYTLYSLDTARQSSLRSHSVTVIPMCAHRHTRTSIAASHSLSFSDVSIATAGRPISGKREAAVFRTQSQLNTDSKSAYSTSQEFD